MMPKHTDIIEYALGMMGAEPARLTWNEAIQLAYLEVTI
jgi:hypothetical protein